MSCSSTATTNFIVAIELVIKYVYSFNGDIGATTVGELSALIAAAADTAAANWDIQISSKFWAIKTTFVDVAIEAVVEVAISAIC